ncbi:MAG: nucleotidyltransferase family protein [Ramlibacter sp.]
MDQPVVLVLASGRGDRFVASGGRGSKLQALLAGKPVLQHTLAAVRASGLPWHLEHAGHPGMGDSIAAGVQATRNAAGWLVLPGDLPLVQPDTLRRIAAALQQHRVVVPAWQGERGHPVGFASECRNDLMALEGPQGAAKLVQAEAAGGRVHKLAVDDRGICTDIDTLADLAAAERLLAS